MATSRRPLVEIYPVLFCAVFIGVLLLPLLGFQGDFAHFKEDFFGAGELRRVYSAARQYILKDIYFDKVIVARDNWLVYSAPGSMDDYQRSNLFSDEDLRAIQVNLDTTYDQLKAQGSTFLVVFPPDKNTIYPEYVPGQVAVLGKQSRLDQVIAYEKQFGKATVVDLRPALLAEKKQRSVYFSTDTHWNPYGALVATREMILALQSRFPALIPHELSDYDKPLGEQKSGDLAGNWLPSAVSEEWFGLEPKYPRQWVRFNISDQMPVIVMTVNTDSKLPRAVIYHDSFMIWQYDFVADYFSKATFIWSYNVDLNYVKGEQADIVILECTERYLESLVANESTWNKD